MIATKAPFQVGTHPPRHSRGYPEDQLRTQMRARQFARFRKWMRGQGVGVDSYTGKPIYFTNDVRRFLRLDNQRKGD